MEQSIRPCADGQLRMGDILGYPRCCTEEYLRLEAKRVETELECFQKEHGARTESDLVRLYQDETEPSGEYRETINAICRTMTAQQAYSIKTFPFLHFTACRTCLQTTNCLASELNQKQAQLAHDLSRTFARKFIEYADDYFDQFQLRQL